MGEKTNYLIFFKDKIAAAALKSKSVATYIW
jgi:hypothetical protein